MARSLSRAQTADFADSIRATLDAIRSGDLDASRGMTDRLEGALVALDAVLGRSTDALGGLLDREK